jgi:hypothetical protein
LNSYLIVEHGATLKRSQSMKSKWRQQALTTTHRYLIVERFSKIVERCRKIVERYLKSLNMAQR